MNNMKPLSSELEVFNEILLSPVKLMNGLQRMHKNVNDSKNKERILIFKHNECSLPLVS